MHVIILSGHTGWHCDELCRALSARGHVAVVLPYEKLVARLGQSGMPGGLSSENTPVLEADAVLARIIPHGSLEQIIYRVNALHWIEARGVPVVNSAKAIERCVDKFYTTALLENAGLPVPETVVCETADQAVEAVRRFGDAIIKPVFGSMGRGMVRLTDADTAFRVARVLEEIRSVFYVQRTIDHGGRDVRVFVVGGRVLAAIERMAPPDEWRTNVARGGAARGCTLPDEWEEVALRAAAVVEADYAGVDLIASRDGRLHVLEVNGIPAWQGLQTATGIDVAAALVAHLESMPRARVVSGMRSGS
jgi:RimK family alpha-L-glutamate ligase